jgi:replicative DNA helicase
MAVTKAPPANLEAEQSVLGAIILRPHTLDDLADLIAPPDFYREAHAKIYQALLDLYRQEEPIDLVTVYNLLKERGQIDQVGGPMFLASLSEQVGFAVNAKHYAQIVKRYAVLRQVQALAVDLYQKAADLPEDASALLEFADETLTAIDRGKPESLVFGPPEVKALAHRLVTQDDESGPDQGFATGLTDLDNLIGGLKKGEMTVVAARPSMGKTCLALAIAREVMRQFGRPAIFSLEMPRQRIHERLLGAEAIIDTKRIETGILTIDEKAAVKRAADKLALHDWWIDDTGDHTPMTLRAKCRQAVRRHGAEAVIIDYLQLMQCPRAKSQEHEVSMISKSLKALAKELHLPVIVLSQLSREVEKRTDKRPLLSDLRYSGAIEQDADVVICIYREHFYNANAPAGIAELLVRKNRNGPTGVVKVFFDAKTQRFGNLEAEGRC